MDESITVERVRHALVVGRLDADGAAVLLAANLPPKRDRTFVVVGASSVGAMSRLDPWLVADLADEVRGDLCVVAPGFGSMGRDQALPPARLLADRLGVEVTAADGHPVGLADGSMFVPGPTAGWVSFRPGGSRTRVGARLPAPWWQEGLPPHDDRITHVPAGLWVRKSGAPERPDDPLSRRVPDPDRMYVVLGAPGEQPPTATVVAGVLRSLPDEGRDRAVLVWYGAGRGVDARARAVALELGAPVRVAHGVPGDDGLRYVDEAGVARWRPFAVESVYRPDEPPVLDRWVAPPALAMAEPGTYRLTAGWRVDVVPRGLIVRPKSLRVFPAPAATETGATADVLIAADAPVPAEVVTEIDRLVRALPEDARKNLRIVPVGTHAESAAADIEAADRVTTETETVAAEPRPFVPAPTGKVTVLADGRIVPAAPILTLPPDGTPTVDIQDGVLVFPLPDDPSAAEVGPPLVGLPSTGLRGVDVAQVPEQATAPVLGGIRVFPAAAAVDETPDSGAAFVASSGVPGAEQPPMAPIPSTAAIAAAPSAGATANSASPLPRQAQHAEEPTVVMVPVSPPAAAAPVGAAPVAAGPVAAGPVGAGPVGAGPVGAASPVGAAPVAAGPVAAGPVAAGPVAVPPLAARTVAAPSGSGPSNCVPHVAAAPAAERSAVAASVAAPPGAVPPVGVPSAVAAPSPAAPPASPPAAYVASSSAPAAPSASSPVDVAPSVAPAPSPVVAGSAAAQSPLTSPLVASPAAAPSGGVPSAVEAAPPPASPPAVTAYVAASPGAAAPSASSPVDVAPSVAPAPSPVVAGSAAASSPFASPVVGSPAAAQSVGVPSAVGAPSPAVPPASPPAVAPPLHAPHAVASSAPAAPPASAPAVAAAASPLAAPPPVAPPAMPATAPPPVATAAGTESVAGLLPGRAAAPVVPPPVVEVPENARSTAEQRRAMRAALGSRYDVATRAVTKLLSERPGLRFGAGDRAALLAELAVVRVFADDPGARYDADFYVCLADGLRRLPTARAVVVRGIPVDTDVEPGASLRLPVPVIAAPATAAAPAGPAEALIWTTTARRLEGLLDEPDRSSEVVLPGHTRLRVLAVEPAPVRRVLLAEDGAPGEAALIRLRAAAAARPETGAEPDSRWFGPLPAA